MKTKLKKIKKQYIKLRKKCDIVIINYKWQVEETISKKSNKLKSLTI